jgi:hypothetical protein
VLQPTRSRRKAQGTTRTRSRWLSQQRLAWLFPFALLFTVRGAELVPRILFLPVYAVGCVIVFATLPSVVGLATRELGTLLARVGRKAAGPGLLVSGRRMAAKPASTVRLGATLIIALGLAAQTQLWAGLFGDAAEAAFATRDRIGTTMLQITPYTSETRIRNLEQAMPAGAALVALEEDPGQGHMEITGSCQALQTVKVPCPPKGSFGRVAYTSADPRLQELIKRAGAGPHSGLSVRQGDPSKLSLQEENVYSLLAVGRQGQNLSIPELSQVANQTLAMRTDVGVLDSSWIAGTGQMTTAIRWVRLMSLVGLGTVALAVGFTAMAEFLRFGRDLAPLSVLNGRRALFRATAGWSLLLPSILAAAAGALVSYWLAAPVTHGVGPDRLTLMSLFPVTGGVIVCATALALWGARAAAQAADDWKPSGP